MFTETHCGRSTVGRATITNEVNLRQRALTAHAGAERMRFEDALQVEFPNIRLRRDAWELISSLRNALASCGLPDATPAAAT